MKKLAVLLFLMILSSTVFASYNVGDVVLNLSWTDNTSTTHNIYDLIDAEKAIVFFWGGTS